MIKDVYNLNILDSVVLGAKVATHTDIIKGLCQSLYSKS